MTKQKIIGLIIILWGVPFGIMAPGRMLLSATASMGLMMIFFAPEPINDERVQHLKMKAMFAAMSSGIGINFIAYGIFFSAFRALRPDPNMVISVMSAYEFLAGILLIASVLFHYWRWQDAK